MYDSVLFVLFTSVTNVTIKFSAPRREDYRECLQPFFFLVCVSDCVVSSIEKEVTVLP